MEKDSLIIYNTEDGQASVTLTARDGNVWLSQQMLAELFDTSLSNVSRHISNILEDNELNADSVIEYYATTASDGKRYDTAFYSLDMILAVGFRIFYRQAIAKKYLCGSYGNKKITRQ